MLYSENIHGMISFFLNLLRPDLWCDMWSILENGLYTLEKDVYGESLLLYGYWQIRKWRPREVTWLAHGQVQWALFNTQIHIIWRIILLPFAALHGTSRVEHGLWMWHYIKIKQKSHKTFLSLASWIGLVSGGLKEAQRFTKCVLLIYRCSSQQVPSSMLITHPPQGKGFVRDWNFVYQEFKNYVSSGHSFQVSQWEFVRLHHLNKQQFLLGKSVNMDYKLPKGRTLSCYLSDYEAKHQNTAGVSSKVTL